MHLGFTVLDSPMLPFSCRSKGWSDLPVSWGSCRTGWSRALCWGRILRTSLIHVLLDKSIRSAWISLLISPVHCHRALWSWLSCWDGRALGRLEGNWDELVPGSEEPKQLCMGWGQTGHNKLVLLPSWEIKPPWVWIPCPGIATAEPLHPPMAQGGFPRDCDSLK